MALDSREVLRLELSDVLKDVPILKGWSSYSQCDEDGIIQECLNRISGSITLSNSFLEIGCGDGLQNNTHQLLINGYRGVWIDASDQNINKIIQNLGSLLFPNLWVQRATVNRSNAPLVALNVKSFLGEESIDFLSLDIDGNDLHILDVLIHPLKPKLICVEYNAKFPPPIAVFMAYHENHNWNGTDYFGASLQAWIDFMSQHGYVLVSCNLSGVNAFFVQDKFSHLFPNKSASQLYQPPRYHLTNLQNGHPPSYSWLRQALELNDIELDHSKSSRKKELVAKTNYGPMIVYKDDQVIGQSLRVSGSFQEGKVFDVVNYLKEAYHFKPELFVDIGANIGTHTVYALKNHIFKEAICFEPEINNFYLLRKNIAINGLISRVEIHQLAISDINQSVQMQLSNFNFGDHRISPKLLSDINFGEDSERNNVNVECASLDSLSINHDYRWSNALIWIDTQGHEGFIFNGAKDFLRSSDAPKFIVCEFWPYGIQRSSSYDLYFDFLSDCKKIYEIKSNDSLKPQVVPIANLKNLYLSMLSETKKEYHPHTDLLLIL